MLKQSHVKGKLSNVDVQLAYGSWEVIVTIEYKIIISIVKISVATSQSFHIPLLTVQVTLVGNHWVTQINITFFDFDNQFTV